MTTTDQDWYIDATCTLSAPLDGDDALTITEQLAHVYAVAALGMTVAAVLCVVRLALLARGGVENLPHLTQWVQRVEQRPAWQKAVERGGPFTLPGE